MIATPRPHERLDKILTVPVTRASRLLIQHKTKV